MPERPQTKGEGGEGEGGHEEQLALQAARIAELEADKLRLEQQLAQLRTAPPRPARPNAQIPFRTSLRGEIDLTKRTAARRSPSRSPARRRPHPSTPRSPRTRRPRRSRRMERAPRLRRLRGARWKS